MAVGKKQLTSGTKKVNPVSTPVAKASTTPAVNKQTETRPYSSPNYSTSNTSSSAKTVESVGSNKNTSSYTPSTPTVSTPSYTPSTPTVSTPSYSAGTTGATGSVIAPMAGTAINPAGLLQTQIENSLTQQTPTVQTPTTPEPTFQNSAQVLLNSQAHPNESPSERTERYLSMLGSVTGATGNASRPYSNPNFTYNTNINSSRNNSGYTHANNNTLEDIVQESVYNSLVGEPGSSAPFTEVPQYNLNNANLAVNGPTAVVANQQSTPTLSDLIAAQVARDYGTPVTNNPVNAVISGTAFDPYAAVAGNAYNTSDSTNKAGDSYFNNDNRGGVYRRGDGLGTGPVGTGEIGVGTDLDALYDLLNRQLAEYNSQYDSLMANLLNAYGMNNPHSTPKSIVIQILNDCSAVKSSNSE